MKKILISLLAIFGMATSVSAIEAKDYSKYYQNLPVKMQQPTLPVIPDNHVSILECGGNGDGQAMNTQAFAKAISKLSKMGGGHLNVPAGIYLTGLLKRKPASVPWKVLLRTTMFFIPPLNSLPITNPPWA